MRPNPRLARFLLAAAAMGALGPGAAHGHGAAGHGQRHAEGSYPVAQTPFGIAGHKREARRTVFVAMGDDMRFSPATLRVKQGETVRLVFRNKGRLQHEWVLGTEQELRDHAAMMRAHPDMAHDAIHMVHVPPGGSDELVWRFNKAGSFRFACLVAGHHEAGMVGALLVE